MSTSRDRWKARGLLALGASGLLAAPVALASGGVALASGGVALASGGLPKAPSYSGPSSRGDLQVRVKEIIYTADDEGFFDGRQVGHHDAPLSWSHWSSTSASGTGFDWVNNCQPTCAKSALRSYPVRLRLWRPRTEGKHLIFTRLTVTYTGRKPSLAPTHWRVVHEGNSFFWEYPTH